MRPWAFGDVWDRMTPRQRRFALWSDIGIATIGAGLMYLLARWLT